MTIKEKYLKLFIKFLKKEKLMNDKELYHHFLEYIQPNKLFSLPYLWLDCKRGNKLNIENKYLDFIEEVFVEDIMRMFYSNPYTRRRNETEIRNCIKKEMRLYGVMSFCISNLHKDYVSILIDFYKYGDFEKQN